MAEVTDYTALLSGSTWWGSGSTGTSAFITFSFETAPADYLSETYTQAGLSTFRAFTASEQAAARAALKQWADVSGLAFLEVPAGRGDIRFGVYDLTTLGSGSTTAGFAYYPSVYTGTYGLTVSDLSGDVFIDSDYADDPLTLLHEIGHAIGLKHPFEGDPTLRSDLDNHSNTVMSYSGANVSVLGDFDDDAASHIYGGPGADGNFIASWSWDAGTYTFTQTGGAGADTILGGGANDVISAGGGDDIIRAGLGVDTIDGGGDSDKLSMDRSTYTGALSFTLANPSTMQSLADGSSFVNVEQIAFYSGSGDDSLTGGALPDLLDGGAGDDNITGGVHADNLTGGAGADTFNFTATYHGVDRINDFNSFEGDKLTITTADPSFGVSTPGSLAGAGVDFVLGSTAASASPTILYYGGSAYWDSDGVGGGGQLQMAIIDGESAGPVALATPNASGWTPLASGNFNNDGATDVLWRDPGTGLTGAWLMSNGSPSSTPVYGSSAGMELLAATDLNGDGTTDFLWKNTGSGATTGWLMAPNGNVGQVASYYSAAGWDLVASGDFNGDGTSDLMWKETATGQTAGWIMSSTGVAATTSYYSAAGWDVIATGDFNGDTTTDLIWKNGNSVASWQMVNGAVGPHPTLASASGWSYLGSGDFNADGTPDLLWKNPADGLTGAWMMSGGTISNTPVFFSAQGWNAVAFSDFNNDGATDILWQNGSGQTAAWYMANGAVAQNPLLSSSANLQVAATGDFNPGVDSNDDVLWYSSADNSTTNWQFSAVTESDWVVV